MKSRSSAATSLLRNGAPTGRQLQPQILRAVCYFFLLCARTINEAMSRSSARVPDFRQCRRRLQSRRNSRGQQPKVWPKTSSKFPGGIPSW
jgi:hypothetical protein